MSQATTGRQMLDALEKRVADLERRVKELETNQQPMQAIAAQRVTNA